MKVKLEIILDKGESDLLKNKRRIHFTRIIDLDPFKRMPCRYAKYGCTKSYKAHGASFRWMNLHETTCPFNPYKKNSIDIQRKSEAADGSDIQDIGKKGSLIDEAQVPPVQLIKSRYSKTSTETPTEDLDRREEALEKRKQGAPVY